MSKRLSFPTGIPYPVQEQISFLIEGDSGWGASLESAEFELSEIEATIQRHIQRGKDDYLPGLRVRRIEALQHRDDLAKTVGCLLRLGQDQRMVEAYKILTENGATDENLNGFVYAAWAADADFSKSRSKHKASQELAMQIAETADGLAELLQKFSSTGVTGPGEFFSIKALLENTDNEEYNGYNLHMWRGMREYILGKSRDRINVVIEPPDESDMFETLPSLVVKIVPMEAGNKLDHDTERENTLVYAWGTAPSVPAMLRTMSSAAREFKPQSGEMLDAVISTRQSNAKTEYIRAFGKLLTSVHGIKLTVPVKKSMAITGNVVINNPEVDVTYDDVRKALLRVVG